MDRPTTNDSVFVLVVVSIVREATYETRCHPSFYTFLIWKSENTNFNLCSRYNYSSPTNIIFTKSLIVCIDLFRFYGIDRETKHLLSIVSTSEQNVKTLTDFGAATIAALRGKCTHPKLGMHLAKAEHVPK